MIHKILTISKEDGLPIIPGSDNVSVEGDFIIAYGPPVKGVNTKWMCGPDQVVAYLREYKPGYYVVVANSDKMSAIDPLNTGQTHDKVGDFVAADNGGVIGGADFYEAMGVQPPEPPESPEEEK
jgi:hypothetical protein